jgi:hypothetical protein
MRLPVELGSTPARVKVGVIRKEKSRPRKRPGGNATVCAITTDLRLSHPHPLEPGELWTGLKETLQCGQGSNSYLRRQAVLASHVPPLHGCRLEFSRTRFT